jgi:hypothetical protein
MGVAGSCGDLYDNGRVTAIKRNFDSAQASNVRRDVLLENLLEPNCRESRAVNPGV